MRLTPLIFVVLCSWLSLAEVSVGEQTRGLSFLGYPDHHDYYPSEFREYYPASSGSWQSWRTAAGYCIAFTRPGENPFYLRISGTDHGPFTTGSYFVANHRDAWPEYEGPCMVMANWIESGTTGLSVEGDTAFVVHHVSFTPDDRIQSLKVDLYEKYYELQKVATLYYNAPVGRHLEVNPGVACNPGETVSIPITGIDEDQNYPLQIIANGVPDGAQFTSSPDGNATIQWTPGTGDVGVHPVEVTLVNSKSESLTGTVKIVVKGSHEVLFERRHHFSTRLAESNATFEMQKAHGLSVVAKQTDLQFGLPFLPPPSDEGIPYDLTIADPFVTIYSGTLFVAERVENYNHDVLAFEAFYESVRGFGFFRYNTKPFGSVLPAPGEPLSFSGLAGEYVGTLMPPVLDPEGSGYFRIKVSPLGTVRGRVLLNGRASAVLGSLNPDGSGSVLLHRGTKGDWTLNLQLRPDGRLLCEIVDSMGPWSLGMGLRRSGSVPAGIVGNYTVLLRPYGVPPGYPQGGFGVFNVSKFGKIRGRFFLPWDAWGDRNIGHHLRVESWVDSDQGWTVMGSSQRLRLGGRLTFEQTDFGDAYGTVMWYRDDTPTGSPAQLRADAYAAKLRPGEPLLQGVDTGAPLLFEETSENGSIYNQELLTFKDSGPLFVSNKQPGSFTELRLDKRTGVISGRQVINGLTTDTFRGVVYPPLGFGAGITLQTSPTQWTYWYETFNLTPDFTEID